MNDPEFYILKIIKISVNILKLMKWKFSMDGHSTDVMSNSGLFSHSLRKFRIENEI